MSESSVRALQPLRKSLRQSSRKRTKSEADNECAKALLELAMSNLPTNDITKLKVDLKVKRLKPKVKQQLTSKNTRYTQIHIAKRRQILKPLVYNILTAGQQVVSNQVQKEHNYATFTFNRYHQYLATMKQNNMVPSLKQMPCAAPISAVSSSLPPSPLRPAVPGRRAKRPRSYRARTLSSTGPTTRPPSPLYSVPADEPRETPHKTTAVKAKGKCSSKRDPTVSATSDDPQLTNYSLPAASDYSTFVERLRAKSAGRRAALKIVEEPVSEEDDKSDAEEEVEVEPRPTKTAPEHQKEVDQEAKEMPSLTTAVIDNDDDGGHPFDNDCADSDSEMELYISDVEIDSDFEAYVDCDSCFDRVPLRQLRPLKTGGGAGDTNAPWMSAKSGPIFGY